MAEVEMKNVPSLSAWVLAAAAGLVGFGVAIVIGSMDLTPAAFIGLLLFVVVGLFLTIAFSKAEAKAAAQAAVQAPAAKAAAPAAPLAAAPVAAAPAAAVASAPAAPVASAPAAAVSGDGPQRLSGPRGGKADNLKEIEGIGPAMEKLVNELGFYHFDQIAGWSEADVAWVDANMKNFKGRITRDKWVAQAKIIVTEGLEAFRLRAKTNDY